MSSPEAGIVKKILISLYGNDVAPRFDLATEVLIASLGEDGRVVDEMAAAPM